MCVDSVMPFLPLIMLAFCCFLAGEEEEAAAFAALAAAVVVIVVGVVAVAVEFAKKAESSMGSSNDIPLFAFFMRCCNFIRPCCDLYKDKRTN